MSEKEIKDLAREYVEYRYRNYHAENRDRVISTNTNELAEIFGWLSKRVCIVEKSKVKEAMNYPQRHTELIKGTMHFQTLGIKKVLTDLFGKELFEDK